MSSRECEYIYEGKFVTSDEASVSVFQVFQREERKKESQRRGGGVKKAIPFLLRGERGGETGKLDSGPELERLAQFTSNATTAILAAITAPVPTGPTLVTPLFTHLRVPLLARHISQETGGWLLYPSMRTTIGLDLQKE